MLIPGILCFNLSIELTATIYVGSSCAEETRTQFVGSKQRVAPKKNNNPEVWAWSSTIGEKFASFVRWKRTVILI